MSYLSPCVNKTHPNKAHDLLFIIFFIFILPFIIYILDMGITSYIHSTLKSI